MNTLQSKLSLKLPNKRAILWMGIEIILLILGGFVGAYFTYESGPSFVISFVYHFYKPIGENDAIVTDYFVIAPSLLSCILVEGISLLFRVRWWKPLGFIVGCIGISLWIDYQWICYAWWGCAHHP